jgi:drug/metabolite transporter (DMT)-like permease
MGLNGFTSGTPSHTSALVLGFVATTLWASSFVLVKMALPHIGPLTIGGLRYFLGFLILLPLLVGRRTRQPAPHRPWLLLVAIGLSSYTIGNGASFWALEYLPATTTSFVLSTIPLFMLVIGAAQLGEPPTKRQVYGVLLGLVGALLFFLHGLAPGEPLGLAIVAIGMVGFISFSALGRVVARRQTVGAIALTAYPLAFGGGALLLLAAPIEGLPVAPVGTWLIILWLAVFNTALAYVLYNHALQTLTALEMTVMLNLSPIGTAILAWLLLGEQLAPVQMVGIVVIVAAAYLVQLAPRAGGSDT